MGTALRRYLHSFTGFGRDARLFLLTTLVFGAAIGLYWIDFNLYLEAIGIDRTTISWLMAASQLAGVVVALPASALSNRIGRRSVMPPSLASATARSDTTHLNPGGAQRIQCVARRRRVGDDHVGGGGVTDHGEGCAPELRAVGREKHPRR